MTARIPKINPSQLEVAPPFNRQIEETVLGCMISSSEALKFGLSQLKADDFYVLKHQKIFETMRLMHKQGKAVDPSTLHYSLHCRGLKVDYGTLLDLVQAPHLVANFKEYLAIVTDYSRRRRLIQLAEEIYCKSHEGASGDDLLQELYNALEQEKIHLQHIENGLLHMNFQPQELKQLLQQEEEEISWLWEPYIPRGSLILLAGSPKVGKSTWVYHLAVAVAKGTDFLGTPTTSTPVLILALEERKQDVRRRLASLAEPDVPLYVHSGPSSMSRLGEVQAFVEEKKVGLVIVDTLGKLWQVADENDAAQTEQAIKPLLQLARSSEAAVVLIHHLRKTPGEEGMDIRGSTALFASVDNALILKRYGQGERDRLLEVMGRYGFSKEVISLNDSGYIKLGSKSEVARSTQKRAVLESLCDEPQEAKELADKTDLPVGVVRSVLKRLVNEGEVTRTGAGKKGSPYLYAVTSF